MQTRETDVQEPSRQSGIYEPFLLLDQVSDEELLAMLRRQQRIYRDAPDWDCWQAILGGELQSVRLSAHKPAFNKVTLGYLRDTEGKRMVNGHAGSEDGILRYLAVGTGNTDAATNNTQLLRETFRAVPNTKANTDAGPQFVLRLNFTEANITTATTIAVGAWSTTVFEVASATGLAVGDAIRVGTTPAASETRITAIAGNQITVDANEPLASVPQSGQAVQLLLGEAGAFGNTDATASANTGRLYSRSRLRIPKNDQLCWFIRYTYLRTAL